MCKLSSPQLQGVNIYDDKLVNKTGLGCGCDITQEIGMGNCKSQILDFDMLKSFDGVELDNTQEYYKTVRTGEDYTSMSQKLNVCLSGSVKAGIKNLFSFGWNLSTSLERKTNQLDIYEYGMTMILKKMYALNIKPSHCSNLKTYISLFTWNELDATGKSSAERTDKAKIKSLFRKYGTHISTKAFYGCLYQYFLFREQNEWESCIEAQLKIGTDASVPIPDTGLTVSGGYNASITDTDSECYKHSYKEVTERRVGGNMNVADLNEWLASCDVGKPETCALLGYALAIGSNSDSGLVPLYELFDEKDERRAAMQEAMQEYIDENSVKLSTRRMVIVDAYGKNFENGSAPEYCYGIDGARDNHRKYFRLNENIFDHVKGKKKGNFYFYYALGHLTDNAVVDMKFVGTGDVDGDWDARGDNSNKGVTGCLKDRCLAVRYKNIKNGGSENDFVSGFAVQVDKKIKAVSKGTTTSFNWSENKDSEKWYSSGLVHDDVSCLYTKDKLNEF